MQVKTQKETDKQLRDAVLQQIDWKPEITSKHISASAEDGAVTLTGFVHTYFEKFAAEEAAKSVYGVRALANDIEVKPASTRTDPEIAHDIVNAMKIDLNVPDDRIKVGIRHAGVETIDAHQQSRALLDGSGALEKIQSRCACLRLSLRRNRIFQVDDDRVSAARHGLVEFGAAIGGYEQKRAHYFGRIRMKA